MTNRRGTALLIVALTSGFLGVTDGDHAGERAGLPLLLAGSGFSALPSLGFASTARAQAPAAAATVGTGDVDIATITAARKGEVVRVRGKVSKFRPSGKDTAPYSFFIGEGAGLRVAVWPDNFKSIAGNEGIGDGAVLAVSGEVSTFKDKVELHVNDPDGVTIVSPAPKAAAPVAPANAAGTAAAPATGSAKAPAGFIFPAEAGSNAPLDTTVTVLARVASLREARSDRAPNILSLRHADGAVDAVYWKGTADQLSAEQKPVAGDVIAVQGVLQEFRGNRQIRINSPAGLRLRRVDKSVPDLPAAGNPAAPVAGPAAFALPTATTTTVAAALALPEPQAARLEVEIVSAQMIRTGQRLTVKDSSGQAELLLWDTAIGVVPQAGHLAPGMRLGVAPRVRAMAAQNGAAKTPVFVVSQPEQLLVLR